MTLFECCEYNDNSQFLKSIIRDMKIDVSNCKWIIADLDLVPLYEKDYSGIGETFDINIAYEFSIKVEKEKVAILNNKELFKILDFTRTVRNGVFICLENKYNIDSKTYRPSVESSTPEKMYDNRAKYEIKILDGELFFVLEEN